MAAKRLGSFLSNVTGTAGQVLRVNSGETGFEMFTPATIPSYSVTNKTIDRAINADDVTLDEVADVLGTLIDDLSAMGSTGATQQVWESQEYVHTNSNTPTTYTLNHNFGKLPDKIICYEKNGNGIWSEVVDLVIESNDYGWQILNTSTNYNTSYVNAWLINPTGTTTIKFRAFILGQVAQINSFQWSSSEQVWPFEKDPSGNTLYCKELTCSGLPNNGWGYFAHGISGLSGQKVFRMLGRKYRTSHSPDDMYLIPEGASQISQVGCDSSNVNILSGTDSSAWTAKVQLIYAK